MKRGDRILIVEQLPLLSEAIEAAADRFSVELDRASDGWEAIEMLEQSDYAAILIDGDLPRHSGLGVLTYLREENGDELGNVIIISSDDDTLRGRLREKNLKVVSKDKAFDALTTVLTSG